MRVQIGTGDNAASRIFGRAKNFPGNGFVGMDFSVAGSEVLGVSSDIRPNVTRLIAVSVHSGVINCRDARGRRWSLLTDRRDFLPRAALVEDLPKLRSGDPFLIDLSNAQVIFQTDLPRLSISVRWSALVNEWVDLLSDNELFPLYHALRDNKFLHELSGFGPGLTPAGDDFITGWITSKLSAGNGLDELYYFSEKWNRYGTTWFSKWMIKDALRGRIWRRGALLLDALSSGNSVTEAVSDILHWGHTSGRAWLAGFAYGFLCEDTKEEMSFCKS